MALREQAQIIDQIHDAVVSTDLDGNVTSWNMGAQRLFGYNADEAMGRFIGFLYPPEDQPFIRPGGSPALREDRTHDVEIRMRRQSGEEFFAHLFLSMMHDGTGRETGIIGYTTDITERMHHRREREEFIAELEAKNEELERFNYTVSHDLKSPLITIRGFLGLLKKGIAAEDRNQCQKDLTHIDQAARKMQELLDDLLELSRVGRVVEAAEDVPLGELAREAEELVAGRISSCHARVDIAPDLPVVLADRRRIVELLQNLIDNAVKFAGNRPDPQVQVGCRTDGKNTVCFVRDNGIGIEPRFHDKVFGLFQRLDPDCEGTGIGLTLAKRIVELHGGRIWIESEGQGRGATVCFTIPQRGDTPSDEKGFSELEPVCDSTR